MSLEKLVPVVKLTDMTDDMQKEVIEVARVAIDRSSTVNDLYMHNFRTNKSLLISRMISDQGTMALGIVLSVAILAHMLPMKPSTTFISTSDKLLSCFSKQDERKKRYINIY